MQDGRKAVWSTPHVSVAFFPSLKHNFIAYRSSKVSLRPDCIFEIHQLWQSGFSTVYSNCWCSCSFEPEIIKIGLSSHKIYSNNILNFQVSTTILNACTKKRIADPSLYNHFINEGTYASIYSLRYIYLLPNKQQIIKIELMTSIIIIVNYLIHFSRSVSKKGQKLKKKISLNEHQENLNAVYSNWKYPTNKVVCHSFNNFHAVKEGKYLFLNWSRYLVTPFFFLFFSNYLLSTTKC